jgi:phenylacetate-coenzyme A ligase PaaK-like adenylate-forming protein
MEQAHLRHPACEAMTRAQLEQIQIEQLQVTLNRVYGNVAFYRTAFDAHKVNRSRLKDLRALRELPFTTKEDLQKSYPYDMFAVPLRDIIRIHTTSGTTGGPIVVGYTQNDLQRWRECAARLLAAAGVTGRTDDLILSQGVGFFPSQIEEILAATDGVSSYFQMILDQDRGIETIGIRVELAGHVPFLDEVNRMATVRSQVAQRVKAVLDIDAKVKLVGPKSLQTAPGGAPRVAASGFALAERMRGCRAILGGVGDAKQNSPGK